MAIVRAQVEFDRTNGLPEDRVVNTFHFSTPSGPTTASRDEIDAAIINFYTGLGAAGAITESLGDVLSGVWRIKQYDLNDTEPRVARRTTTPATFTPGSGTPLPSEVAVCMSYQTTYLSGVAKARQRGRLYIGPVGSAALGTTTEAGRPSATIRNRIAQAGARLLARPSTDAYWCVYSPTSLPTVLTSSQAPEVVSGWVDNAFDIQRRRGLSPTSRITF